MEIYKELKGGSLSKTVVIRDGSKYFVRKYISIDNNREYGLVRWQSQIRKLQIIHDLLPDACVDILSVGVKGKFYYYDIPYHENCFDCYTALVNDKCSPQLMSEKIIDLLHKFADIKYGLVHGSLSVYAYEEILNPIIKAQEVIESGEIPLSPGELELFKNALIDVMPKIRSIISRLENISCLESLTHGNMTLENLLWDESQRRLIIIDPYAETYCESLIGDVSQILQSAQSGYEYISQSLAGKQFSIFEYPIHSLPPQLNDFTGYFTNSLAKESWYSDENLLLFRASQFTRMFPFKLATEPRLGVLFILHGISLLNQIKC